jgi:hypothetical protein
VVPSAATEPTMLSKPSTSGVASAAYRSPIGVSLTGRVVLSRSCTPSRSSSFAIYFVAVGEPIPRDSDALEILWNFAVAQNTLHSGSSGITSPHFTLFHFGKEMFTIYALTIVSPKRIFALWKIAGRFEAGYLVIAEKTLRKNHEGGGTC